MRHMREHDLRCQRPGATLIEVLVAIFVMSIGLMALLALFPLGALRMAQAIKDDRAANTAATGSSLAQARDLRNDITVGGFAADPSWPWLDAYADPNPPGTPPAQRVYVADPDGPSYPVFVDPIGFFMAVSYYDRWWVGGSG